MDAETPSEVPALVPARMVNQYVFCPRFFHLAWVAGETGENDLTIDGKWIHRRVDEPTGRIGDPDSAFAKATSVTVSSERLGVIAKVDIAESRDGRVVPIELKRGRPKAPDHPVWRPERIQLATNALVLRDNGYRVDYGEVRFAEAREHIPIELTPALVDEVESVLSELRLTAVALIPPDPLVDSPKCPTCIMAAACLPDEHNLIRSRSSRPARRLVPSEDAARPLYLTEPGTRVGVDGERLAVKKDREILAHVRLIDVSQVSVFGNVQISTQAIRELLSREIPICWFSGGGWFFGIADGLSAKNVELRRRQVFADDLGIGLRIARRMVAGKILNARVLLRRNSKARDAGSIREMKRLAVLAEAAESFERLLGLEGGAARVYFSQFSTMVRGDLGPFDFERRTRRPPADPINCLLSYVYGLLVKDCTTTVLGVGFDPYSGMYHRPRFGRPALALDLAEEFRPLVADSTVLTLVNNGEIRPSHFVVRGGAAGLTAEGRRTVISAYERRLDTEVRHPTFGYSVTYRRALEVQARLVGATLLGEIDDYRAMVTR